MLVLVEGNIASGKTTLCRLLPGRLIEEHVAPSLLRLFYAKPERYAFALQLAQCLSRRHVFATALAGADQCIIDRSIVGDFAFAAWNHACGNLTDDEWAAYLEYAGGTDVPSILAGAMLAPDPRLGALCAPAMEQQKVCIVYLRDDSASCRKRALARSGAEDAASAEYFAGLQLAHDLAWRQLVAANVPGLRLVRLSWTRYHGALSSFTERMAVVNAIFATPSDPADITTDLALVTAASDVPLATAMRLLGLFQPRINAESAPVM